MDTSQNFLVLALLENDRLIDSVQKTCWKRQSEELFPQLQELLNRHHLSSDDIGEIVITIGPGSYTGVRIAMTVAKVFCALKQIPLYTLGSLQLAAGMHEHVHVIMDARGHRAYHAVYEHGAAVSGPEAADLDLLREQIQDEPVLGDARLIGREDCWPDLAGNFAELRSRWQPVENIHLLVPEYLKNSDAYLVKKS